MNRSKFWLMVLAGLVDLAMLNGLAAAQPAPITACGKAISAPGAYVVTANLKTTSSSTPCITVSASPVTIDLGGFMLSGAGPASVTGISVTADAISISNGFVTNFKTGISAKAQAKLTNVTLTSNGVGAILGDNAQLTDSKFLSNVGNGLQVGKNALVVHCTLVKDGAGVGSSGDGLIAAGAGAVVTESVAANNAGQGSSTTGVGFRTGGGATLTGNAAGGNAIGFADLAGGDTFEGNTAAGSSGNGFLVLSSVSTTVNPGPGSFIGNAAVGNGGGGFDDAGASSFEANTANSNGLDGFREGGAIGPVGSTFVTNTADSNTGFGFLADCPANYIGNTAEGNSSGGFTSDGTSASDCNRQINLGF